MTRERIAKTLSRHGVASRRAAERMIEAGRVAVNGTRLSTPAFLVGAEDNITVDGRPLPRLAPLQFFLLHKPVGYLVTMQDWEGRPTLADLLPPEHHGLKAIGRLDFNSEGLLLLTNDGEAKRQWEHPNSGIGRLYRVRVFGRPSEETLADLRAGMVIDGFRYRGMDVRVEDVAAETRAAGGMERDAERGMMGDRNNGGRRGGAGDDGYGRVPYKSNFWLMMELREGKNREIRRIMDYVGHPVSRLLRVGYGHFRLGDLPAGAMRTASAAELLEAKKIMTALTTSK